MDVYQKIRVLQTYPLFQDFNPNELAALAQRTQEKTFPAGTAILDQAKPASVVYFIYQGLVKIYILNIKGRIIPIRIKQPPYLVGEMNLFDNESSAGVEAIFETQTLVFTKEDFIHEIYSHPSFAFNLLSIMNEKLRAANNQTNHQSSLSLKQRIWQTLKTLAPHFPDQEINLSQEELALMVGASRARVSEMLTDLVINRKITLTRRKIHLV